ncbi:UDP-glycosyltransferase 83A1-like [Euphorbia lathyris]|uniref:UDP-glycosyltransferase 83A1-like n=1 Tax=Euphorbia lathyris TaxID=212925 RepID=UPI0033133CB0
MGKKGHVVVTPYPAQGHLGPLMKLAYKIAQHGIKVTFVNADYIHDQILSCMPHNFEEHKIPIRLVPVSTKYDRKDGLELIKSVLSNMPCNLLKLIEKLNEENKDEKVSCVVTDPTAWWGIEVAKTLGIKGATLVPFGVGNFCLDLHSPKLIDSGFIDHNGVPLKDELIYLSKETLPWNTKELTWSMPNAPEIQKFVFRNFTLKNTQTLNNSDWILVNSFYELEQSSYNLIPKALPVGPLITTTINSDPFPGNIWNEDSTCLNWLHQQPKNSVIYAAFGSTTICNQQQFHELAYALELMGQPFLWVVRSNFTQDGKSVEFPQGFKERVGKIGKIVEWAPQEKVLAHSSISCFFSHCGWNSTIEGVSNGVPFLCWPYYTDQMRNGRIISEFWKVGVRVFPDEFGIVTRYEIKSKMENLLCRPDIKANAVKLMAMATKSISEGGSSSENFMSFIQDIKH